MEELKPLLKKGVNTDKAAKVLKFYRGSEKTLNKWGTGFGLLGGFSLVFFIILIIIIILLLMLGPVAGVIAGILTPIFAVIVFGASVGIIGTIGITGIQMLNRIRVAQAWNRYLESPPSYLPFVTFNKEKKLDKILDKIKK